MKSLAPQLSGASVHTRSRHRATSASSLQRCSGSTTLSCRIATGNMYLASPRPWGINSRGGERSFTRRCVVRGGEGGLLYGRGGAPKGHGAQPWGCPHLFHIHVGGAPTQNEKPPLPLKSLHSKIHSHALNFHQI